MIYIGKIPLAVLASTRAWAEVPGSVAWAEGYFREVPVADGSPLDLRAQVLQVAL